MYVITGASDTLTTVEEDHPTNRFNDAKCDQQGRLWAGTMGFEEEPGKLNPHMGSLYSYTGGTVLFYVLCKVSNTTHTGQLLNFHNLQKN